MNLTNLGIIISILLMDMAMSGDNAIAINALVMKLDPLKRVKAIYAGMGIAVILRAVALTVTSFIMSNPWVQILGGLYLIKLCISGIFNRDSDGEESSKNLTNKYWKMLLSIGILDLSLSLDNVIAVIAITQQLWLVITGVILSMIILTIASQIVRIIMERYPTLETAANVILGFLGVNILLSHGPAFILWVANKMEISLGSYQHLLSSIHIEINSGMESLVVGCIILIAIMLEELKKRYY